MERSARRCGETKVILTDVGGHKGQGPKNDGEGQTSLDTSRRQRMAVDQRPLQMRATRQM